MKRLGIILGLLAVACAQAQQARQGRCFYIHVLRGAEKVLLLAHWVEPAEA